MPVVRTTIVAAHRCALLPLLLLLIAGCRSGKDTCPSAMVTVDPADIPAGSSQTNVTVTVSNPDPITVLPVVTELTASSGSFADPFARETTYVCPHDISGPVEICAHTFYQEDGQENGADQVPSNASGVGASQQYLRKPHARLPDPLECSETECMTVTCPEERNSCPVISTLTVEPMVVPEGGTATVVVVAEDPDDNPQALVTTLSARFGTIADPSADQTTYACDPDVGGVIEICVLASDGDASCDVERCTGVRCPGEPLENTCPIIESFTATPTTIPVGETMSAIVVDAIDPDEFPEPLHTELTSATGVFGDRFASETTFTCGDAGPVELCVKASDGDPSCAEEKRCITVQCPSDIPPNLCPQLFVINAIPSTIPAGQISTNIQTRGQDTDFLPLQLVLTLNALWGSFENTENLQCVEGTVGCVPTVVFQDAIYICDRPGEVEVCVDATDGACTKTLCRDVQCPDDIPIPP